MNYKVVGTKQIRWDAHSKVTGQAEYTRDIPVYNLLYGKLVRAKIAHGLVLKYDIEEALKVPGVIKILTADDLPDKKFSTAGHPYKIEKKFQDKKDTNFLAKHVRYYGQEIAAVITENEIAAEKAAKLVKVEYEKYPFYLTPREALAEDAVEIQEGTKNLVAETQGEIGNVDKAFKEAEHVFQGEYQTQMVQHAHMENQVAYAYQDVDGRWICVSSTQIPHICRHILGDAFNMPYSKFRVIKPFVGGGFGNKQDIIIEPIVVAMSMAVGGRPVVLELTREEVFSTTRVRHPIDYDMKIAVDKDNIITAIDMEAISQNGAYTSHGHAIALVGEESSQLLFNVPNFRGEAKTVYTNTATAGAMRAYGTPQSNFALNSLAFKAAKELNIDPVDFYIRNVAKEGETCFGTKVKFYTMELQECLIKGREIFSWKKRKKEKKEFNKEHNDKKRGLGIAALSYASNTRPHAPSVENAGCRLILNQDGSVKMMIGATEIGQGSDTVLAQMVAEVLGISYDMVYADKVTDTDVSPFDPGSFASRQTFVSGMAVKAAAEELREKILQAYVSFNKDRDKVKLDLEEGWVVNKDNRERLLKLEDLSLKTYYDLNIETALTSDVSIKCDTTVYSGTVCFAYVEVDMKIGRIEILDILNVHDAGKIINPITAEGQVEGGMAMGIAYGLSEELMYDKETGKPLNDNLLDYKIPTFMDVPDLKVGFVEPIDPVGPFGNKSLGEPPLSAPAPAIRNALFDATGIEINSIPLTPQKVLEHIWQEKNK